MNVVLTITETGPLGTGDLARVLGVSERTVQRWVAGDTTPRRSDLDHLLEVKAVLDLAGEVLPDYDLRTFWLRTPNSALNWEKPLDLVRDRKYRRVIAALTALGEGVTS